MDLQKEPPVSKFAHIVQVAGVVQPAGAVVALLIKVADCAVLSAVGIVVFSSSQAKARDAKRKGDINQIADAMEIFYGRYNPNQYAGMCQSGIGVGSVPTHDCSKWFANSTLPVDQNSSKFYCWSSAGKCGTGEAQTGTALKGDNPSQPPTNSPVWYICANLDAGGTYCRNNKQ